MGVRALIGVAFLVLGCGEQEQARFAPPPMPVETALVTQGAVADRFEAVGTIEAGEAIEVVAEIDAIVEALPFQEGAAVQSGELLAQLDDATLQAERARAEALRDQRRVTHERIRSIVEQGAGAPQDLDDALASLKVAEANLQVAEARLEKTRIEAPFAGIVGSRHVSPGAFLRAGQTITELARIDEIKVSFWAPERHLSSLKRGVPVRVTTTAYPGEWLEGRIDVVEPILDASLRAVRIMARVKNPENKLRPGMSANVAVTLDERPEALTVPGEAVFVEGQQAFVYVVQEDSTVTRAAVTLGTRLADVVEVTRGLDAGMRVVRAGHQKLYEGAKAMPLGEPDAGEETP
jgi:membrane fusion protein (multidrug efflux system)